ncbi:Ig-like domain-containing protein [Streptomyces sp. N35]|uniref:Ig-like domain-containing protein n=1 Tax=Streptomyces sp. N35 TaxID=2795730 RepID=UPI0018F4D6E0|nr:Ig-like domain-containing protein [Streptomyces sp. N35]
MAVTQIVRRRLVTSAILVALTAGGAATLAPIATAGEAQAKSGTTGAQVAEKETKATQTRAGKPTTPAVRVDLGIVYSKATADSGRSLTSNGEGKGVTVAISNGAPNQLWVLEKSGLLYSKATADSGRSLTSNGEGKDATVAIANSAPNQLWVLDRSGLLYSKATADNGRSLTSNGEGKAATVEFAAGTPNQLWATGATAPKAVADTATTTAGKAVTLDILNNDDSGSATGVDITTTNPGNGTITRSGGKVTYTPKDGFTGTDTFRYTITNAAGQASSAIVTVTVEAGLVDGPAITSPAKDGAKVGSSFRIEGTSKRADGVTHVALYRDDEDEPYATVRTNATTGAWWLVAGSNTGWTSGNHSVRAVGLDADGKAISQETTRTFSVAASPVITTPGNGATVGMSFRVEGTSERGDGVAKINLYRDNETEPYATVRTNATTGNWWLVAGSNTGWTSGAHSVTAVGVNSDGDEITGKTKRNFTVAAAGPVITSPSENGQVGSSFRIEGTSKRADGVTNIELYRDNETEPYANVRTNATTGNWWLVAGSNTGWTSGNHSVTAVGVNADGKQVTEKTKLNFEVN